LDGRIDPDGLLERDPGEWILLRVEGEGGVSRVGSMIPDPTARSLQERFERGYYQDSPPDGSVVTVFFGVSVA
jgi:hypothetical protein